MLHLNVYYIVQWYVEGQYIIIMTFLSQCGRHNPHNSPITKDSPQVIISSINM